MEKRDSIVDSKSISLWIKGASEGNRESAQKLWISVYEEIRKIAQRAVDREYCVNSIQATELVHEAYLRISGNEDLAFEGRSHLIATVARAIRRLLIDRARERKSEKRGGQMRRVVLDDLLDASSSNLDELIDLDQALEALESTDRRLSQLIELRFFAGMTLEEAADVMKVSLRTANSDWAFAKAWLRRHLDDLENKEGP